MAAVVLVAAGKECMEGCAVVPVLEVVMGACIGGKVGAAGTKLRAPLGLAAACGNVGAACHGGDSDVVGGRGAQFVTVRQVRAAEAMVVRGKQSKRGSLERGAKGRVVITNKCHK